MKEIQKYKNPEIVQRLKQAGKFEIEKYELVNRKIWDEEYHIMRINSMDDALKNDTPSLVTIDRYKGFEVRENFIIFLLSDLLSNLNVSKKMTPGQLRVAADVIYQEFKRFTVADFKLCFRNILAGKYGQAYGMIDIQVLCGWMRQYWEERMTIAGAQTRQKSDRNKKADPYTIDKAGAKRMGDMYRELLEKKKIKESSQNPRAGHKDNRTTEQKEKDRLEMQAEIEKYQKLHEEKNKDNEQ